MSHGPERKTDRRSVLRAAARWSLLAGGGVAAAHLVNRSVRSEQPCQNQQICRGCPVVPECGLPQALSYRAVREEQKNG